MLKLDEDIIDQAKSNIQADNKNQKKTLESRIHSLEITLRIFKFVIALSVVLSLILFGYEYYQRTKREHPYIKGAHVAIVVKRTVNGNKTIRTQVNSFLNKNNNTKKFLSYHKYMELFERMNDLTDKDLDKCPTKNTLYFFTISPIGPKDDKEDN